MRPIVARLGPISYDNSRGTPTSTMVIQFSGNGSRIWELTASYSTTLVKLQLTQIRQLLEETPNLLSEDPGQFNGTIQVVGMLTGTYDVLTGRNYDYDLSSLVTECKELINRHSVTLGISTI